VSSEVAGRKPRLLTWVFARVMLVNFGYFLSLGIMNPVLPRYIAGPLHGSPLAVGFGVGSFTVVSLLLRPWSGRMGDRRGRKQGIVVGALAHTLGTLGMLVANTLPLVIAFRMLTGIAEAFLFVGASTAAQDLAPNDRRAEAASLFSVSLFSALAIGPTIGELLMDEFGFDTVWLAAAAVVGIGALVAFTLPDTRTQDVIDSDSSGPLIHRAALRPGFPLACAIWSLAAFQSFVPLYATRDLGLPGARTVLLANALTILALRLFAGKLPDQLGHLRTARMALIFNPLGVAVMALWATVPGLYVGTVLFALGQAFAFPSLMTIAVNNAPPSERGSVMGTFTAFFDLSFGGGAIVLGAVASAVGYRGGFLTAMVVALIGTTTLFVAPPPRKIVEVVGDRIIVIEPPGE
jgi:MFS family permease